MDSAIATRSLRKVYNSAPPAAAGRSDPAGAAGKRSKDSKQQIVALDGIDLEVAPGQIFGLLGPNGAGKSTTVGILTTRVRPTSGTAWIGKHDVWQDQKAAKRLIGVVAQRPNLDFTLTAREILLFHGAYFGIPSHERSERATALLDRFKLTDRADQLVRGFSGGMMQRISIARAMMHDPQVLFLDEPSVGLDPQTRLLLWEIIREYNQKGRTILLTTHNMEEADTLCQQLAIIDHGKHHRAGNAAGVEGVDSRRIPAAPAFWTMIARAAGEASQLCPTVSPKCALSGRKRRRSLCRAWRIADSGDCECGGGDEHRVARTSTSPSPAWKICFSITPAGVCANELEGIYCIACARRARGAPEICSRWFCRHFCSRLFFVFIFGRVMVGSGYMPAAYKSLLLPGIMAISMVFTGVWAVAMPLIAEFQFTREIEDRLLAPIDISWVAVEKVVARADSGVGCVA